MAKMGQFCRLYEKRIRRFNVTIYLGQMNGFPRGSDKNGLPNRFCSSWYAKNASKRQKANGNQPILLGLSLLSYKSRYMATQVTCEGAGAVIRKPPIQNSCKYHWQHLPWEKLSRVLWRLKNWADCNADQNMVRAGNLGKLSAFI